MVSDRSEVLVMAMLGSSCSPCCCGNDVIHISVIDEDSSYSRVSRDREWCIFRTAYPERRFFLLRPLFSDGSVSGTMGLPSNWDGTGPIAVGRPGTPPTDWFSVMGLQDAILETTKIVLWIDNSGSMTTSDVRLSLTAFVQKLEEFSVTQNNSRLHIIEGSSENWICPHLGNHFSCSGPGCTCASARLFGINPNECLGCQCDAPIAMPDSIEVEVSRGQTGYATAVIGESPEGGPDEPKFACAVAWGYPDGIFTLTRSGGTNTYNYTFPNNLGSISAVLTAGPNRNISINFQFPLVRFAAFADTSTPPTEAYLLSNSFLTTPDLFPLYLPKNDASNANYAFSVRKGIAGTFARFGPADRCVNSVPRAREVLNRETGNPQPEPQYRVCSSPGCAFPMQLTGRETVNVVQAIGLISTTTDLALHRNNLITYYMFTFSETGVDGYREGTSRLPFATKTATCTIESVRLVYGGTALEMFTPNGTATCTLYSGGFSEPC